MIEDRRSMIEDRGSRAIADASSRSCARSPRRPWRAAPRRPRRVRSSRRDARALRLPNLRLPHLLRWRGASSPSRARGWLASLAGSSIFASAGKHAGKKLRSRHIIVVKFLERLGRGAREDAFSSTRRRSRGTRSKRHRSKRGSPRCHPRPIPAISKTIDYFRSHPSLSRGLSRGLPSSAASC